MIIPSTLTNLYTISFDGQKKTKPTITAPSEEYSSFARHSILKGVLYIFGGGRNPYDPFKIAKLRGCSFEELSARLNFRMDHYSAVTSLHGGEKGKCYIDKNWLLIV